MKVHSIKRSTSAMAALQSSEPLQHMEQYAEPEWPTAASFNARAGGKQSKAFGAAAAAAIAAAAAALQHREDEEALEAVQQGQQQQQQGGSRGGGSQNGGRLGAVRVGGSRGGVGSREGGSGSAAAGAGSQAGAGGAVSEEALGSDEFFELAVGGGTSSW
jgi:hypothetical protein